MRTWPTRLPSQGRLPCHLMTPPGPPLRSARHRCWCARVCHGAMCTDFVWHVLVTEKRQPRKRRVQGPVVPGCSHSADERAARCQSCVCACLRAHLHTAFRPLVRCKLCAACTCNTILAVQLTQFDSVWHTLASHSYCHTQDELSATALQQPQPQASSISLGGADTHAPTTPATGAGSTGTPAADPAGQPSSRPSSGGGDQGLVPSVDLAQVGVAVPAERICSHWC